MRDLIERLEESKDPRGLKSFLRKRGIRKQLNPVLDALSTAYYELEGDASDLKSYLEVESGGVLLDNGTPIEWPLSVYKEIYKMFSGGLAEGKVTAENRLAIDAWDRGARTPAAFRKYAKSSGYIDRAKADGMDDAVVKHTVSGLAKWAKVDPRRRISDMDSFAGEVKKWAEYAWFDANIRQAAKFKKYVSDVIKYGKAGGLDPKAVDKAVSGVWSDLKRRYTTKRSSKDYRVNPREKNWSMNEGVSERSMYEVLYKAILSHSGADEDKAMAIIDEFLGGREFLKMVRALKKI
jgi:hypothetical protein